MKLKTCKLTKLSIVAVWLLVAAMLCYTAFGYWNATTGNKANDTVGIIVGDYEGADRPIHVLPDGTPQYIIDRLNELSQSASAGDIELLEDAIARVIDYPPFINQDTNVIISTDIDGLFDGGSINEESFLIYIEDGELVFVHVTPSGISVGSPSELFNALSHPWTGINAVTNLWLRGNQYNTFNAALEYEGRTYLMNFNGPSGTPPPQDSNTWFAVPVNYLYDANNNRYYRNYIVMHEGQYYIAGSTNFGNSPASSGWSPWNVINLWTNGSYNAGSVVRVVIDGRMRFFRALVQTSAMPTIDNARLGIWQEINNGWIGRNGDDFIKSYYFEHNHYEQGTTVIYGVSPKMKYNYFTAKQNVPSDQPPLIYPDGSSLAVLNDTYWEVYS